LELFLQIWVREVGIEKYAVSELAQKPDNRVKRNRAKMRDQ